MSGPCIPRGRSRDEIPLGGGAVPLARERC